MEILYILIPIAIVLVAAMVGAFFWAARSGQFDDLDGPAHRILMEDDEPREPVPQRHSTKRKTDSSAAKKTPRSLRGAGINNGDGPGD